MGCAGLAVWLRGAGVGDRVEVLAVEVLSAVEFGVPGELDDAGVGPTDPDCCVSDSCALACGDGGVGSGASPVQDMVSDIVPTSRAASRALM
jgi:hypothetical protein